jgi:hypothetical protein
MDYESKEKIMDVLCWIAVLLAAAYFIFRFIYEFLK